MPKRHRPSKSPAKRMSTQQSTILAPVPPGPPLIYTQHPGVTLVPSTTDLANGFKTVVDKTVLMELAETHASYEQMARILLVDVNVLRDPEYVNVIEIARAHKVNQLLSAQFKTAIEDRNPTMQIWLGKNYAGQKDISRTELTGPDGKPVQMQEGPRLLAVMPINGRDLGIGRQRPVPALAAGEVAQREDIEPTAVVQTGEGLSNDE